MNFCRYPFMSSLIDKRNSLLNRFYYSTISKTKGLVNNDRAALDVLEDFEAFKKCNKHDFEYILRQCNILKSLFQSLPTEDHLKCLNKVFKLDYFKPVQWTIISSILIEGRDNFATMPTGFGKSLCYQYPAVYTNSLSVVISPLISLMQDQVKFLEKLMIPSSYLGPAQSDNTVLRKLFQNHYRIVYMTPETALSSFGVQILEELNNKLKIILLSVDEAHCVLQWGNNFRPMYKDLGMLRSILPSVPMLALTGTTTIEEKYGIFHFLSLRNPNEVNCGFNRPSLYYMTRRMTKEPYGDISQVLIEDKKAFKIDDGSVIIYCLTRKKCEKVANILNRMGIISSVYHSGLSYKLRMKLLEDFMNDSIQVIVSTTAFGMGINKPDVRIVIHYGTPLSMEGYYQEVGRAGRDGKTALCVLYYSHADFFIHRYLNRLNTKTALNYKEAEMRNNVMKKYVSLMTCRRKFILEYFGSTSITANHNHGCCDNCRSDNAALDTSSFTKEIELLLNLISSHLPFKFGMKHVISILLGTTCNAFSKNSVFFGQGCHRSEEWWIELIFLLEIEHYVKYSSKLVGLALFTLLELDFEGKKWLSSKNKGVAYPININVSKKMFELSKFKVTENK